MFKLFNDIIQNKNTYIKSKNVSDKDAPNSFLNDLCESDDFEDLTLESLEQSNNQKKIKNNYNKKDFLNDFAKNIFSIILDSRKDKNNHNLVNTSNNSDFNKEYDEKSFSIDIDDLFLYNDFSKDKSDIQKFVMEFYLIKNKKIKTLVEKWKISYKLNDDNETINNNEINYLKNKISILKKSIISYSRILPLYQYIKLANEENDYSIDFKFYNNNSKKKGQFLNKPSGRVSLKNSNLFSFKLNIKYYSEKEIKYIFDETRDDEQNKHRFKSLSFNRKKSTLNQHESINDNNEANPINKENDNYINKVKTCEIEVNNKIKEIDSFSNSSFILSIQDNDKEENKNILNLNLNSQIGITLNKKNHKDNNEYLSKRKCSNFSNSYEMTEDCTPRNNESKLYDNKDIKKISSMNKKTILNKSNNKEIKNIFKEYNILKEMMQNFSSNIIFKNKKLMTYLDVFE